jgi:hypothetical protein
VNGQTPGHDEVILTTPPARQLCNSLACARAGQLADVIVTYGVLSDPGASPFTRQALWRESWGKPIPMCATCWDSACQVAIRYRPRLTIRDATREAPTPAARM